MKPTDCEREEFGGVSTLANSLRGMGLPGRAAISESVGLVATMALLFALLPLWGIVGAAVASLAAYGIVALLQLQFVFRASGRGCVTGITANAGKAATFTNFCSLRRVAPDVSGG